MNARSASWPSVVLLTACIRAMLSSATSSTAWRRAGMLLPISARSWRRATASPFSIVFRSVFILIRLFKFASGVVMLFEETLQPFVRCKVSRKIRALQISQRLYGFTFLLQELTHSFVHPAKQQAAFQPDRRCCFPHLKEGEMGVASVIQRSLGSIR